MRYLTAIMFAAVLFSHSAFSETVSFDSNQLAALDLRVGDEFEIDIVGTGFDLGTDGGGINFGFGPTIPGPNILRVDSVTIDETIWDFFADPGVIDNNAGTVTGINFATSLLPSDFLFATVTFTAVGVGVADLTLSESIDIGGWALLGEPQMVDFLNSNLEVVPLPAGVWLMVSGLLGLIAAGRRKGNRKSLSVL